MAAVLVYLLRDTAAAATTASCSSPSPAPCSRAGGLYRAADAPAALRRAPSTLNAFIYQQAGADADVVVLREGDERPRRAAAILAAAVAVTYMLSPTSSDALTAFIYQDVPMPTSLLTAQQMSAYSARCSTECAVW